MEKDKKKSDRITVSTMTDEGAQRLAAAIVEAAVNDYRDYSFKLKRLRIRSAGISFTPSKAAYKEACDKCLMEIRSSRNFFFSRTFSLISNVDPNWLIETLEQQVAEYVPYEARKVKKK